MFLNSLVATLVLWDGGHQITYGSNRFQTDMQVGAAKYINLFLTSKQEKFALLLVCTTVARIQVRTNYYMFYYRLYVFLCYTSYLLQLRKSCLLLPVVYVYHCRGGNLELVTYLIQNCQVSVHATGQHNWSPLHYACR